MMANVQEGMTMKVRTRRLDYYLILATVVLLAGGVASAGAAEETEPRLTTTSEGKGIRRGSVGDGVVSHDEFKALVKTGKRENTTRSAAGKSARGDAKKPGSSPRTLAANTDFWFYSADVQLFGDVDGDGYWSGIDLAFDADTIYDVADVYAVLYLSYELGPWNEYAETEVFSIYGASSDDEYFVESDLVSGYPTGDYDVLIELYDTYDDSFVASFGPDESSALSFLPLEDIGRDTPPNTTVVVSRGGGGALGWLGLFALLGIVAVRRAR